MKKFGLNPITWRTFVRTTDSRHALRSYRNLIKRNLDAPICLIRVIRD